MASKNKERCDVRIWSGECSHADAATLREKYLCKACGRIDVINHEVSHEFYSNVIGDYKTLS